MILWMLARCPRDKIKGVTHVEMVASVVELELALFLQSSLRFICVPIITQAGSFLKTLVSF